MHFNVHLRTVDAKLPPRPRPSTMQTRPWIFEKSLITTLLLRHHICDPTRDLLPAASIKCMVSTKRREMITPVVVYLKTLLRQKHSRDSERASLRSRFTHLWSRLMRDGYLEDIKWRSTRRSEKMWILCYTPGWNIKTGRSSWFGRQ